MGKIIFLIIITSTIVFGNNSYLNQQSNEWHYFVSKYDSNHIAIDSVIKSNNRKSMFVKNYIPKSGQKDIIWIKKYINLDDIEGNTIYIYTNAIDFALYVNNKSIFQYKNSDERIAVSNIWYPKIINLPKLEIGDIIVLKFPRNLDKNFWLPNIVLGNSNEITKYIFLKSFGGIIISTIFFVLAIITLIFFIFLEREKIILGLFVFLISTDIFIAVNIAIYQLVLNSLIPFFYLNKIAIQLSGITFFYILAIIINKKYKKIIDIIWISKTILFILSLPIIFIWYEHFDKALTTILFFNMFFLVIGIFIVLINRKIESKQNRILMLGMIFVMSATLIQTYTSFVNVKINLNTTVINIGASLFSISIIWLAVSYYLETKKEKERMKEIEFISIKRENEARSLFSSKLIESQENERNRIALELHDSIGQKLLLIKNLALSRIKSKEIIDENITIQKISNLSDDTISEIRNIIHNLRPQYLDQLGLSVAIESMTEKITELSGINIICHIEESINKIIPKNDQINLFRIIQESLNNVVKHSQADEVFLSLTDKTDFVLLEVRDNGVGFQVSEQKAGTGLTSMYERAKMLNSNLEIFSNENGTKILMHYPLNFS